MDSFVEHDPFGSDREAGTPLAGDHRPIVYHQVDIDGARLLGAETEAFARSVFDASPDCIKLLSLDGELEFMNRNGLCAMEIDDFDALRGKAWPTLWPDDSRDRVAYGVRQAASGRPYSFEAFCPTAKGTPRWWEVSVTPVLGANGRAARVLSVSRDVTERVERERGAEAQKAEIERVLAEKESLLAEKTLLMQEVDHRVKNSLTMINSLLRVQARNVDDDGARDALKRASVRVQTIASVHERLYHQGSEGRLDLGAFLGGLCQELDATAEGTGISLDASVDRAGEVDGSDAVAIGLIVTELVTNAIRHARPEGDPCCIEVSCRMVGEGRELVIADDGCGLPDDFDPAASKGLGMRVVLGNLRRFGGTLEAGERPGGGTRFRITF